MEGSERERRQKGRKERVHGGSVSPRKHLFQSQEPIGVGRSMRG